MRMQSWPTVIPLPGERRPAYDARGPTRPAPLPFAFAAALASTGRAVVSSRYAATLDRLGHDLVRAGLDPHQTLSRHRVRQRLLQPAARQVRLPDQAADVLPRLQCRGGPRRAGARLRDRQGPV